jgi:hypothetical protein
MTTKVPHESSKLQSKLNFFPNLLCYKKLWSSSTQLPSSKEINNHWHFKAVCQVHKFFIIANILDPLVQQCVLNQSQGYWLFYNAHVVAISFVCQMQVNSMTFGTIETQDFDSEIQFLQKCMQK